MSTDTKNRPQWVFDGCGINGPDEYRSRLATLTPAGQDAKCGALMVAAPELLEFVQECAMDSNDRVSPALKGKAIALIDAILRSRP